MHIEETEIALWMPDWTPGKTSPFDTRQRKRLEPFWRSQRAVLVQLRQELLDSLARGVTTSRSASEASPFITHQADVGSDTYDREFALRLLSHENDALYEIDQALKRIELGTYGVCELSGKPIPHERLEAIPFARFTVEVQSRMEREKTAFGLSERTSQFSALMNEESNEEQNGDERQLAHGEI
jgi:RNA polymerase-binding protein DksA